MSGAGGEGRGLVALFCGSRNWKNVDAIRRRIEGLAEGSIVVHGAAWGADTIAGRLASERELAVHSYPAEWQEHRDCNCTPSANYCSAAGPRRNQQMLDIEGPDIVYAFRLGNSRGTSDMIRRARKAFIPVEVLDA